MSERPHFSLAYTTARPHLIAAALRRWFDQARYPENVEAIVCVDQPDAESGRRAIDTLPGTARVRLVVNAGPRTCVAGWNEAAKAVTGEVVIALSDDFAAPPHWDEALATLEPAGWWCGDRVVAVWDGNNGDVFTLPILTRTRLARFGYLFHPSYESLYCDAEFTAVAKAEGVVIEARHLLFEHHHYEAHKRPKDPVDVKHASPARWDRGAACFAARRRAGFPVDRADAGRAASGMAGELRFAVHVLANKDDFCLAETLRSLLAQSRPGDFRVAAVFVVSPDEYWSGRPTSPEELAQLQAAIEDVRRLASGVEFEVIPQPLAGRRGGARQRTDLETSVRNAALLEMRRRGFEHVLVADTDEWWRPGALAVLAALIRARRPESVATRMMSVVGLPGYPVDGARNWSTIYVGPDAMFASYRLPSGRQDKLRGNHVLHFTATRRTMEEIVRKHRESGHYDDPDYDFEGWITDVLPKLRPGATNAHMYRPEQIWPRVRRWHADELAELPTSLRPFLGPETETRWRSWLRRFGLR